MKLKKLLSLTTALAIAITIFSPITANAQVAQNDGIEVDMGNFYYHLPNYDENEVIIENIIDTENNYIVNIVNQETGTVLETIACKPLVMSKSEKNNTLSTMATSSTDYYAIQRDIIDPIVTIRLEIVVKIYRSGSFSSVQSIEGSTISAISSSYATLENGTAYASSASGSFPSTHIQYRGSGTITLATSIEYGEELSIGFSIPEIAEWGYSFNWSTSSTVYLRKPVSIQGDFYTYSQK